MSYLFCFVIVVVLDVDLCLLLVVLDAPKNSNGQLFNTVEPQQIGHPAIRTPRQSGHGFSGTQPRESNEKKTEEKDQKTKFRTYFNGIERTSR